MCKKPGIDKMFKEGYKINFIYVGDKKSVMLTFTDCK
jgi:hypothetical protein